MNFSEFSHREASPNEYPEIGKLMIKVFSKVEGFPTPDEQPDYYKMLANVGSLTENPEIKLFVVIVTMTNEKIGGAIVYTGDMKYYKSGGIATLEKNAAGFRLLAVDPSLRGKGLGRCLSQTCIDLAKSENQNQVIIHTTKSMQAAWRTYEQMGLNRSEDLDFMQGELPVLGFRLPL